MFVQFEIKNHLKNLKINIYIKLIKLSTYYVFYILRECNEINKSLTSSKEHHQINFQLFL